MIEQEVRKSYQVEIERIRTHVFVVDEVNSPEEAEAVAEEWLTEGEDGTVMEEEILGSDAYPVDNKEDLN